MTTLAYYDLQSILESIYQIKAILTPMVDDNITFEDSHLLFEAETIDNVLTQLKQCVAKYDVMKVLSHFLTRSCILYLKTNLIAFEGRCHKYPFSYHTELCYNLDTQTWEEISFGQTMLQECRHCIHYNPHDTPDPNYFYGTIFDNSYHPTGGYSGFGKWDLKAKPFKGSPMSPEEIQQALGCPFLNEHWTPHAGDVVNSIYYENIHLKKSREVNVHWESNRIKKKCQLNNCQHYQVKTP